MEWLRSNLVPRFHCLAPLSVAGGRSGCEISDVQEEANSRRTFSQEEKERPFFKFYRRVASKIK